MTAIVLGIGPPGVGGYSSVQLRTAPYSTVQLRTTPYSSGTANLEHTDWRCVGASSSGGPLVSDGGPSILMGGPSFLIGGPSFLMEGPSLRFQAYFN